MEREVKYMHRTWKKILALTMAALLLVGSCNLSWTTESAYASQVQNLQDELTSDKPAGKTDEDASEKEQTTKDADSIDPEKTKTSAKDDSSEEVHDQEEPSENKPSEEVSTEDQTSESGLFHRAAGPAFGRPGDQLPKPLHLPSGHPEMHGPAGHSGFNRVCSFGCRPDHRRRSRQGFGGMRRSVTEHEIAADSGHHEGRTGKNRLSGLMGQLRD